MVAMTDVFAHASISDCLQPGEKIIWLDKPDPWTAARQMAFPLVFITFWTAFVLFAAWRFFSFSKQSQDPNFGLIVIAVLLSFGAFSWYKYVRALLNCWATVYALTDRRIIIASGGDTQSFTAAALGDLSRTGDARRGSLIFGNSALSALYGQRSWAFGYPMNGLYGIENPGRVEALIYETLIMPKEKGTAS
jgi:hypothetical protein